MILGCVCLCQRTPNDEELGTEDPGFKKIAVHWLHFFKLNFNITLCQTIFARYNEKKNKSKTPNLSNSTVL